jgi:hypothetical protein
LVLYNCKTKQNRTVDSFDISRSPSTLFSTRSHSKKLEEPHVDRNIGIKH